MMIEFSVTNFRSIKETQTLSMVAANWMQKDHPENTFCIKDTKLSRLLKSAAIYGANAAGKTNLIRAMSFMVDFVLNSHKLQEGDKIDSIPFLLNKKPHINAIEFSQLKWVIHDFGYLLRTQ